MLKYFSGVILRQLGAEIQLFRDILCLRDREMIIILGFFSDLKSQSILLLLVAMKDLNCAFKECFRTL